MEKIRHPNRRRYSKKGITRKDFDRILNKSERTAK
jgi:hypothetical protein